MSLALIGKGLMQTADKWLPQLLTAGSIISEVASVVLIADEKTKADDILKKAEEAKKNAITLEDGTTVITGPVLTNTEKFKLVWKTYAPGVGLLLLSIAQQICGTWVAYKRLTGALALAAIAKEGYERNQEQIDAFLKGKKPEALPDISKEDQKEIAKEVSSKEVMAINDPSTKELYLDDMTGQLFWESPLKVMSAISEAQADPYISKNDLLEKFGLQPVDTQRKGNNGYEEGWDNTDHSKKPLRIRFGSHYVEKLGRTATVLMYQHFPYKKYDDEFYDKKFDEDPN